MIGGRSPMRASSTFFYDIDTQRDFILPDGALHGPLAVRITPALGEITRLARERGIKIVASVDRHFPGDLELARNGGLYPDHCMDGTPGQHKIDETKPLSSFHIENAPMADVGLCSAIGFRGDVIIEKQDVDVFKGNCNARKFITRMLERYRQVVVYGVFSDICVDLAIRGLTQYQRAIYVVTDAIAPLDEVQAEQALRRWRAAGVIPIDLAYLRANLS